MTPTGGGGVETDSNAGAGGRAQVVNFVTRILSDVYGQPADPETVDRTADRVLATIPTFREANGAKVRE
jgi:hypothetical protein